jgi:hypothetical protein
MSISTSSVPPGTDSVGIDGAREAKQDFQGIQEEEMEEFVDTSRLEQEQEQFWNDVEGESGWVKLDKRSDEQMRVPVRVYVGLGK